MSKKLASAFILSTLVYTSCGSDDPAATSVGGASATLSNKVATRGLNAVSSARNSSRAASFAALVAKSGNVYYPMANKASAESTACNNLGEYITDSGTSNSDLDTIASGDKHGEHIWCAMTVDSGNPEKFKGMLSKNLGIMCSLDVAIGGFTYATSFTTHTDISIDLSTSNSCFNSNIMSNSDLSDNGTVSVNVREKDVSSVSGSKWDYQIEIDLDKDGTYEQVMFIKDGASDGLWAVKDIEMDSGNAKSLAEVVIDSTNGKALFFSGETTAGNERDNRLYVEGTLSDDTGSFSSVDSAKLILSTSTSGSAKVATMNYSSSVETYRIRKSDTSDDDLNYSGSAALGYTLSNLQHATASEFNTYNDVTKRLDFTSSEVASTLSTLY